MVDSKSIAIFIERCIVQIDIKSMFEYSVISNVIARFPAEQGEGRVSMDSLCHEAVYAPIFFK